MSWVVRSMFGEGEIVTKKPKGECWKLEGDWFHFIDKPIEHRVEVERLRTEGMERAPIQLEELTTTAGVESSLFFLTVVEQTKTKELKKGTFPAVYTDGACIGNGRKNARASVGIAIPEKDIFVSEIVKEGNEAGKITNNVAELTAILVGIQTAMGIGLKEFQIISDSEYSIKCLTVWYKKWKKQDWHTDKEQTKPVKNAGLIRNIIAFIESPDLEIQFKHVPSHQKNPEKGSDGYWNNVVDELATKLLKG